MKLSLSERSRRRLKHLAPNEWAALEELVDRLYRQYEDDLQRVVLFGSKARGDFDEESDLDVLIILKLPQAGYWRRWREIVRIASDLDLEFNVILSLLIRDEVDYAQMQQWDLLIHRNIHQDGVELWTLQPSVPSLA
jgi:predicted nucleotidyltransferase